MHSSLSSLLPPLPRLLNLSKSSLTQGDSQAFIQKWTQNTPRGCSPSSPEKNHLWRNGQ